MADTDLKLDSVDSSQSANEDVELNSWLWRLKTQINRALRQVKLWINNHVFLEFPYFQDPHPQYWHKILDPAWMHMYFQDFDTPKRVNLGETIANYTGNVISDWQVESDLVAGTVTISSETTHDEYGVYFLSFSGYVEGPQNTNFIVTAYANGNITLARMPVVLKGNATNVPISWAGVVDLDTDLDTSIILELRLEVGAYLDFYNINWCIHRLSPIAGQVGVSGVNSNLTNVPPTDNWNPGSPGGMP